ncbi:MAG TPA: hypothetical protein VFK47_16630, partial [Ktedonobacteraceae bacterium]|nr:hypothetical protein [Ktedonobacteraceae bacterium]
MMVTSMRKKIAMLFATLLLAFVPMVALPVAVHADAPDIATNLKCGSNLATDNTNGCTTETGTSKVNGVITTVINIFSAVVGIVSVIMIIFGGFKYITSGGESS